MDNHQLKSKWNSQCRFCLSKNTLLVNIFESSLHIFLNRLITVLPYPLKEEILPQKICYKCLSVIDNVHEFWRSSLTSNNIFNKDIHLFRNQNLAQVQNCIMEWCCPLCSAKFDSSDQLATHNLECLVCKFCYQKFNTWHNRIEHQATHLRIEIQINESLEKNSFLEATQSVFKCNKCLKVFGTSNQFWEHIQNFHKDYVHECTVCTKKFPDKIALDTHKKIHIDNLNKSNLKCSKCKSTFTTLSLLKNHNCIQIEYSITCNHCNNIFKETETYDKHAVNCQYPIPIYTCNYCKIVFPNDFESFIVHYKKHEFAFKCNICSKVFSRKSFLEKHICVADKFQNIGKCNLCSMELSKEELLKHDCKKYQNPQPTTTVQLEKKITSALMNEKQPQQQTTSLDAIKREKAYVIETTERFSCSFCNLLFDNKQEAMEHVKLHNSSKPFKCPLCSSTFQKSNSIYKHIELYHPEPTNSLSSFMN